MFLQSATKHNVMIKIFQPSHSSVRVGDMNQDASPEPRDASADILLHRVSGIVIHPKQPAECQRKEKHPSNKRYFRTKP